MVIAPIEIAVAGVRRIACTAQGVVDRAARGLIPDPEPVRADSDALLPVERGRRGPRVPFLLIMPP